MRELNPDIIKSKVVVFAGAGASAHLGYPTGGEFLYDLYARFGEAQDDVMRSLFNALENWAVPPCAAKTRTETNFEQLYESADILTSLISRVCLPPGGVGAPCDISMRAFEEMFPSQQVQDWMGGCEDLRKSAEKLQRRLRAHLIRTYGVLQPEETLEESCWPDFLHELCSWGYITPVFTTNYDLALEDLERWFGWRDVSVNFGHIEARGVRRISPDEYEGFDLEEFNAAVFRLHGCVAWQRMRRRAVDADGAVAFMAFDPATLRPVVKPDKTAVIWPSPSKLPFEREFWRSHEYLVECVANCRVLAFIGYGFADRALMSLVSYAAHRNRDLCIVALDPASNSREKAIAAGLPQECIGPTIRGKFEDAWRQLVEEVESLVPDD